MDGTGLPTLSWVKGNALVVVRLVRYDAQRRISPGSGALQEAHEQAVVSTSDRAHFAQLVEELLAAEGLPATTSQKDRSKRTRFI